VDSECIFREIGVGTTHATTNIYFVRWQPNAQLVQLYYEQSRFLLWKAGTTEYVGEAAGRFGSEYWQVSKTLAPAVAMHSYSRANENQKSAVIKPL
jgi:hypothetical protein